MIVVSTLHQFFLLLRFAVEPTPELSSSLPPLSAISFVLNSTAYVIRIYQYYTTLEIGEGNG